MQLRIDKVRGSPPLVGFNSFGVARQSDGGRSFPQGVAIPSRLEQGGDIQAIDQGQRKSARERVADVGPRTCGTSRQVPQDPVGGPPDPSDSSATRKSVGVAVSFESCRLKVPPFLLRVIVKQLCSLFDHDLIFPVTDVGIQRQVARIYLYVHDRMIRAVEIATGEPQQIDIVKNFHRIPEDTTPAVEL